MSSSSSSETDPPMLQLAAAQPNLRLIENATPQQLFFASRRNYCLPFREKHLTDVPHQETPLTCYPDPCPTTFGLLSQILAE